MDDKGEGPTAAVEDAAAGDAPPDVALTAGWVVVAEVVPGYWRPFLAVTGVPARSTPEQVEEHVRRAGLWPPPFRPLRRDGTPDPSRAPCQWQARPVAAVWPGVVADPHPHCAGTPLLRALRARAVSWATLTALASVSPTGESAAALQAGRAACDGPVGWWLWGPCCVAHGRADLLRRAARLGWPPGTLPPLLVRLQGEADWRAFLAQAGAADLGLAHRLLRGAEVTP